MFSDNVFDHFMAHVGDGLAQVIGGHYIAALVINNLTLVIHHIIIFQQVFTDVIVAGFHLFLGLFNGPVDPGVHNGFAFFQAEFLHQPVHTFPAKDTHQVIFHAEEEFRITRVTLTAGTTAQLVINTAAFMTFSAQHEQTTGFENLLFIGFDFGFDFFDGLLAFFRIGAQLLIAVDFLLDTHFQVTAQLDVGSATGHVGGNCNGTGTTGLTHNIGFLFMEFRVQHVVWHFTFFEHFAEIFRFFNADCTHQDRLTTFVTIFDQIQNGVIFFRGSPVNFVVFIHTGHGHMGRHLNHFQAINGTQFFRFGGRRTGHAAEFWIKPEIILEGHRSQGLVFRLNFHTFFGFQCLMQAIGITSAFHHTTGEFINDHHLAITDDIVFFHLEHFMGTQGLISMMHHGHIAVIIHIVALNQVGLDQNLFQMFHTHFGQADVVAFFIQVVIFFHQFRDDFIHGHIKLGFIFGGAGNDQWGTGFVHQNTIHLIHNGKGIRPLYHGFRFEFHVIAQIIKAQFIVGGIGNVGTISGLTGFMIHVGHNTANTEAEEIIHFAHPL